MRRDDFVDALFGFDLDAAVGTVVEEVLSAVERGAVESAEEEEEELEDEVPW
jgi:hypothetical protein